MDLTGVQGSVEYPYPSGPKLHLVTLFLFLPVFLVALGYAIIAAALGAVTGEYGSVEDISWYGSFYLLTSTALQPLYGRIYQIFNILAYILPLRRRPLMFGMFVRVWGVASVTWPLLGGAFADHITRRWCFYINLSIEGLAMAVIPSCLDIMRVNSPNNWPVVARTLELTWSASRS
ncbi:hypothetical protein AAE478_007582 [Parahypoxylon ruwenzoriense]